MTGNSKPLWPGIDLLIAKRCKEIMNIRPKKVWVPVGYEGQAAAALKANGYGDTQIIPAPWINA